MDRGRGLKTILACMAAILMMASAVVAQEAGAEQSPLRPSTLLVTVPEGSHAHQAGLRDGDLVHAWRMAPTGSQDATLPLNLDDPWAWTWMTVEYAPRGPIQIYGTRKGEEKSWILPGGVEWGITRHLGALPGALQQDIYDGMAHTLWETEWRTFLERDLDDESRLYILALVAGSMGRDMPQDLKDDFVARTRAFAQNKENRHALLYLASCLEVAALYGESMEINAKGAESDLADLQQAWHQQQWGVVAWGTGDNATAKELWAKVLITREELAPDSLALADSLHNAGALASSSAELDKAEALHHRSLAIRQKLDPGSVGEAKTWYSLALVARTRGKLNEAEELAVKAVEALKQSAPDSGLLATGYNLVGTLRYERGDLSGAMEWFEKTLGIYQRVNPDSLDVAATLNNLGVLAETKGDWEKALDYQRRALDIKTRIAPGSDDVAASLQNMGAIAMGQGDLAKAQDFMEQSIAIYRKLGLKNIDVASSLANLGAIAWTRGNLIEAEQYYLEAQAIREDLAPDSLEVASGLNNLGLVARDRSDLASAKTMFERSRAIQEKHAPGSLALAGTLSNLGDIAAQENNTEEAEALFLQALAIQQKHTPDGPEVGLTLANLGQHYLNEDDMDKAEDFLQRALTIRQSLSPGGLHEGWNHFALGRVSMLRKEFDRAEARMLKGLLAYRRLASGSDGHAIIAHRIGMMLREAGRKEDALSYLQEAVAALEEQMNRLGGSREQQEGFAASRQDYYFDLMALLKELGREEEAFGIFERSRARSMRQMLAQRDLVFTQDLPAELDMERRALALNYDSTMDALGQISEAEDPEQFAALMQELKDIRRRFDQVRKKIAETSPRFAALVFPEPLTLKEAQAQLPKGSLALGFALGLDDGLLFVLGSEPGTFKVIPLPEGRYILGGHVNTLRNKLTARQDAAREREILASLLLSPVVPEIAAAERLLILPDGPLHLLPWAVLTDIPVVGADPVKLPPTHYATSMTLYRDLAAGRSQAPEAQLIQAFGDPAYSSPAAAEPEATRSIRSMFQNRGALTPLPGTRREVTKISKLFPRQTQIHLGGNATENRLKTLPAATTMVHVAVHGFVDPDYPLDSALAFSTPQAPPAFIDTKNSPEDATRSAEAPPETSTENGFLQVWEIFEQVRLPSTDLVVLSACDTALGKDLGGEGIAGLGRAFQYAGAESVVVSLWKISDASTAQFMEAFYKELAAGHPKDIALYKAQQSLAKGRYQDPFYWAPFILLGRPD